MDHTNCNINACKYAVMFIIVYNMDRECILCHQGFYINITVSIVNTLYCIHYIFLHQIYSNKKETSDFHGTVSFNPVKMSQQK